MTSCVKNDVLCVVCVCVCVCVCAPCHVLLVHVCVCVCVGLHSIAWKLCILRIPEVAGPRSAMYTQYYGKLLFYGVCWERVGMALARTLSFTHCWCV